MANVVKFNQIYDSGAGIDIGSREIFISIDGVSAVSFKTFTADYHACCAYLVSHGISAVAMEATGVYWFSLYSLLEDYGIRVCLVNPCECQQVKGRKSDVSDCQWIQRLFVAGLLRESIIPEGLLKELRFLVRERNDLIRNSSMYVNKMQTCLELMNIKLTSVISQIHGASGLRIIRAILSGERDTEVLLSLCHNTIVEKKAAEVKKALEGNYNPYYLYMLKTNLHLWEEHNSLVKDIEQEIDHLLTTLNKKNQDITVDTPAKPSRHHTPMIPNLHIKMIQLYGGIDLTSVAGINDSTLLRLYAEVGADMSRFPTVKHFISWLGLSPKNKQSGKMKRRIKSRSKNQGGLIFRQSAQSLMNSKKNAIGAFIRRLKNKKGAPIALKAGARKIAQAYYFALTKGIDYVEQGAEKYLEQQRLREIYVMKKLAKKYNYSIDESA